MLYPTDGISTALREIVTMLQRRRYSETRDMIEQREQWLEEAMSVIKTYLTVKRE